MSSTATAEPPKKPQPKSKTKEKRQGQTKASGTERLKIIVRRLPPNLPEQIFWQSVQPWVTDDTVLWKEFYPGKSRGKRQNKEDVHSRAYIAFKTEEYVAKFSREYDGHIFKDKAGNESQAVVEFAPYQKLPLDKKKVDNRNATIDQDEEYVAFLQSLETLSTKSYDADQLLEMLVASTERPAMPASTPLLDALKAEKSAQRDKEAIQRNHPHYKDAAQASKKEESKKKAAITTPAAAKQSGDPATPLGKRAAKRAAAAQKASGQTSASTQLKAGGTPTASSSGKPPPSPSKSKSTRASKHHASAQAQSQESQSSKPPSAPPQAASSSTPPESGGTVSTSAPAPAPAGSSDSGRRQRPVLGLASRHFEAALSGAGVSAKGGGNRRDRGAEKERDLVKDGAPREQKEGGSRKRKEDDATARTPALTPQPGVLPVPTILQREAKLPPSQRPSQQASSDNSTVTHAGRGSGKRGRGRGRGRGGDRGAPTAPPPDS